MVQRALDLKLGDLGLKPGSAIAVLSGLGSLIELCLPQVPNLGTGNGNLILIPKCCREDYELMHEQDFA